MGWDPGEKCTIIWAGAAICILSTPLYFNLNLKSSQAFKPIQTAHAVKVATPQDQADYGADGEDNIEDPRCS